MRAGGDRVTAGAWPTADEMTLDALKASGWAGWYDIGFTAGEYYAFRLIGGPLLTARTPAGLESAIRADFSRWRLAAGDASC